MLIILIIMEFARLQRPLEPTHHSEAGHVDGDGDAHGGVQQWRPIHTHIQPHRQPLWPASQPGQRRAGQGRAHRMHARATQRRGVVHRASGGAAHGGGLVIPCVLHRYRWRATGHGARGGGGGLVELVTYPCARQHAPMGGRSSRSRTTAPSQRWLLCGAAHRRRRRWLAAAAAAAARARAAAGGGIPPAQLVQMQLQLRLLCPRPCPRLACLLCTGTSLQRLHRSTSGSVAQRWLARRPRGRGVQWRGGGAGGCHVTARLHT
jgi:hypothetical protein